MVGLIPVGFKKPIKHVRKEKELENKEDYEKLDGNDFPEGLAKPHGFQALDVKIKNGPKWAFVALMICKGFLCHFFCRSLWNRCLRR